MALNVSGVGEFHTKGNHVFMAVRCPQTPEKWPLTLLGEIRRQPFLVEFTFYYAQETMADKSMVFVETCSWVLGGQTDLGILVSSSADGAMLQLGTCYGCYGNI